MTSNQQNKVKDKQVGENERENKNGSKLSQYKISFELQYDKEATEMEK